MSVGAPIVPVLQAAVFEFVPGLVHGFFGRHGGVSCGPFASLNMSSAVGDDPVAVRENWAAAGGRLGAGLRFVRMRQVHSDHVAEVEAGRLEIGEADAMITDQSGLALTVLTADCVPILLVDSRTGALGVAHAGWKGTLAGIAAATVQRMCLRYGSRAADIRVAMGPSMAGCCYEVDAGLVGAFSRLGGGVGNAIREGLPGKGTIDLRAVNSVLLERLGVPPTQIEFVGPCTGCCPEDFFSHRVHGGETGRQLSSIAWRR